MTERTLFVHAGGFKTGSSALQNFFELHASELAAIGIAYENRLHIQSEYEMNSGNGRVLIDKVSSINFSVTTSDADIDQLVLSYFGDSNRAICSTESFAEFKVSHWKRLAQSLERLGIAIEVVFYVRNVIPYLLSFYDQVIKRHGEYRSFDEWAAVAGWQHCETLRIIKEALPETKVQLVHYDSIKSGLIRGFLGMIGIEQSFEVDPHICNRLVNRSLTARERAILRAVNEQFGSTYSTELSDFLIFSNPEARGEPVAYNQATEDMLLKRFGDDVNWINDTFFGGKAVVSVFPAERDCRREADTQEQKVGAAPNEGVELRVFGWVMEKLKFAKSESEARVLNALCAAARNTSKDHYTEIPEDFDPVAYLLLNPDVLLGGIDPVEHFIYHGKAEGRVRNFANRADGVTAVALNVTGSKKWNVPGIHVPEEEVLLCRIEVLSHALAQSHNYAREIARKASERERTLYERLAVALRGRE